MTPPARDRSRVAVVLSAHGLGHAARASAVLDRLADTIDLELTVVAAADRRIWPARLGTRTRSWVASAWDAGVVQSDDVTVDLEATRRAVEGWMRRLPDIDREARGVLADGFDLVLGDVPSPVFPVARSLGIPAVALANFTWDWIYSELGLGEAAEACRLAYGEADLLLEARPAAPMAAFARRVEVGLVSRRAPVPGDASRGRLGLAPSDRVVLLAFQASSAPGTLLPAPRAGRVFLAPSGWPRDPSRPDLRPLPEGFPFEEALGLAQVVVGKPGYGLLGDVEARGTRFLYVPRPGFPENALLEAWLAGRQGTASVTPASLAAGAWEDTLTALEEGPGPVPRIDDGAGVAASVLASILGSGTASITGPPGRGTIDSDAPRV